MMYQLRRFLRPIIHRAYMKDIEKKGRICRKCKGNMVDTTSYLYLLPVKFSEAHEESAGYYIKNARRIDCTDQIPSGSRACYMYVFQCQNCGDRMVSVVDFLHVRGKQVVKGGSLYPYEVFREFFLQ